MAQYSLGSIIKEARERMNLTQEELSLGICSSQTLSKIETEARPPSQKVAEKLLEKLGLPVRLYNIPQNYKEEKRLELERLLYRYLILDENFLDFNVFDILGQYKNCDEKMDMVESQTYYMYKAIAKERYSKTSASEVLNLYVTALQQTQENFTLDTSAYPKVMTFDELSILTSIARLDYEVKNKIRAFERLKYVSFHYENKGMNILEISYRMPKVLCTLSKWAVELKKADEAVFYAQKGLDFCSKNNRNLNFDYLAYYKACGLALQKNKDAEQAFEDAFYVMDAMGHSEQKMY